MRHAGRRRARNMQSVQPKQSTPFHDVRDPDANPSCPHCKQAVDLCECIRGRRASETQRDEGCRQAGHQGAARHQRAGHADRGRGGRAGGHHLLHVAPVAAQRLDRAGKGALRAPMLLCTFCALTIMSCVAADPCWTRMCAIQAPSRTLNLQFVANTGGCATR